MRVEVGMMQKDNFSIRQANFDDVEALVKIDLECFSSPWSEISFKNEMAHDYAICYVVCYNQDVVGYINARKIFDEISINNVAVAKKYRRMGIGEMLINHLFSNISDDILSLTLEVRESNIPAQNLYSKCGYEKIGVRRNFYDKPTENAILMTRYI